MAETCSCSAAPTLFFPCSGGSNVGQLANDISRQLAMEGHGKHFCLAGIGAHISGMVASAKAGSKIVAIDGCPLKCAAKTLAEANVPVTHSIVLTDWGVDKTYNLFPESELVQKNKERLLAIID